MTTIQALIKSDDQQMRRIWNLAWPVIMGQFLHSLMVTADMWFIARLGSVDAAAVGTGTSIIAVIQVLPFLVASGAIALVSRLTGADDQEGIKGVSLQGMMLSLGIGVLVTIFCFINMGTMIKIFGRADASVLMKSQQYIFIVLLGVPFFFFNATTKSILQATGDTKNPVKVFILMNVINILLDFVFITVFKWGIRGAALATITAESIGFFLMGYLIFRHIFNFNWSTIISRLKMELNTMIRILKIGSFSALQMLTRPLTGLIMYRIVLEQGVSSGAAFGIGGRLFNFVFIFLAGLGTAMSVLVGQYLGKSQTKEAEKVVQQGLKLAILNMIVFFIPFFIYPKYLVGAFISDPEVIAIGVEYLRICYMGVIFVVFPNVMGSAFVGAGDTFPPMVASIAGNWFVKIPLAFILTKYYPIGTNGVWIAISLSVVVEAFVILVWFYKGKWKEKII